MNVPNISSLQELQKLGKKTSLIVLDFYTTWCGPCKRIAPEFQSIAIRSEYTDKVGFVKVDAEEAEELADKYRISCFPTFIITDATGNALERIEGADLRSLTLKLGKQVAKRDGKIDTGAVQIREDFQEEKEIKCERKTTTKKYTNGLFDPLFKIFG